jgi:hypothetical protein
MPRNTTKPKLKRSRSLRAAGLRLIEIWVPDSRRKGFKNECRRQSLLLKNDSLEQERLSQIGSIFDDEGWV